ncbi:hypothetical protein [Streptosporangium sp. KLBMP 9127]|nr:hypothetical protein [Streptosporangium sp. KLBMP 9127]
MMLPFTSLDAATSAPQEGAARDYEGVLTNHTMLVTATGSPSQISVQLQGSHDGSTWVDLANTSSWPTAVSVQRAVRYVRARLGGVTGGSSPTVTATIAST